MRVAAILIALLVSGCVSAHVGGAVVTASPEEVRVRAAGISIDPAAHDEESGPR
jgi:hypothetical protein